LLAVNQIFCLLVWLSFGLSGVSAHAALPSGLLGVEDVVPNISALDQRGKQFNSTNGVRYLLIATEMACAKAANLKLAAQGADFLETNRAAYLLDIHTMPAVARWFALPKMRTYPERIVLVDNAGTLAAVPVQAGRVTVLALTPEDRVRQISYWDPVSELVDGYLH